MLRFSEHFDIKGARDHDWFDPFLNVDTPLFIDPRLVEDYGHDEFEGAYSELIAFFELMYTNVAKSGGNRHSAYYRRTIDALLFPEVKEACLGYSIGKTSGAGSGLQIGSRIADAIIQAIADGFDEPARIEEVAILSRNIGIDRISDLCLNVLKHRFIKYTQRVCHELNLQVQLMKVDHLSYSLENNRWKSGYAELPQNPYTSEGIILVPKFFLRRLLVYSDKRFLGYLRANYNEEAREQLGLDIGFRVSKDRIVEIARKFASDRRSFLLSAHLTRDHSPYDFENDPLDLMSWKENSQTDYFAPRPGVGPTFSDIELVASSLIDEYKHSVEEQGAWQLLWRSPGQAQSERHCQLLFMSVIKGFADVFDIDVSPETNIGRGPVDFKISRGAALKVLIEFKKGDSSKLEHGYEKQLEVYGRSERVRQLFYVVICFSDGDVQRTKRLMARRDLELQRSKRVPNIVLVDARRKPSASTTKNLD